MRWLDVSLVPHGVAADGTALAGDAMAGDAMAAVAAANLPLAGAFVLRTDITRFHDAEQGRAHPSELPCESALLHQQGQVLPVALFARELQRDGEPLRMVAARDIRDRQAAHARLQHLAEHDALTGLRNRGAFMAELASRIARHRDDDPALALLFVDLDHFQQVNDAHGHLAGDALLRGRASRQLARPAGRCGGRALRRRRVS